ncbi:unnamed protein product [Hyaloperonospora brassicae]|uniref:GYF domain-containing protein n=1 Tax=Hyaloperonospora brassicae TaxID=162125 RepID=A0AAV0USZ3_HYABA|nr:unnamed protein product [Hyaloperonospora brassicae]
MAVTAFDMEDEKDEGHFDADGNFVWDDEARKQEEAWLEDVSEQQIGAAKHAKSRREFRDEQTEETLTVETATQTLATLLRPRETVLQALRRLGTKKKKQTKKKETEKKETEKKETEKKETEKARARVGSKRKQRNETEEAARPTAEEKAQFDRITEAADFLLRSGEVDAYSQVKEEFISDEELLAQRRRVQFVDTDKSEEASEDVRSKQEAIMWEYRAADGQIHGPFPTSSYVAWRQQGYFTGETAVDVRQVLCASDASAVLEPATKKKLKQQEDGKVSAEQEMLDDFEDSDNGDDTPSAEDDKAEANEKPWMRSDTIDFSLY